MKKERIRSKRGFKGLGSFILGWFVGLVSTFAILFGVGYWAYSSISVRKIEKWTKTEITDNKGVESLTLKKAVGIIQGIADNGTDAYTLAQLEEDFNVKLLGDKIFGISTDIIKNSPITELKQALNDTIDTATFNNVLNFLDINQDELGLLNTVLESDLTYYVYNGKLYTNEEYTIEVGFKYTIENNTVEFANGTHTISSNSGVQTIKPRLSDLPLNTALSSMTDATKGLKIYEILDYDRTGVEGNYTYTDKGNEVSGIMASLAEYTIDDLSDKDKFNNIYIYEVMGYKLEDNGNYTYINENNEKVIVTGTMKTLAGKTIGDMSNPDTINNLYVYEVMGYERTGEDPNYIYKENNNEVTGIMATLAGKKISELDDAGAFNDVTVADAMGYTIVEGVVYDSNDNVVEGLFAHIADAKVSGLSSRINTLELGQVLDIELDEANGIIKALHGTKVEDLSKEETINNIYIYQVMDYYKNGDKYYETYDKATDTYSDEVTGVMKALAGKMVGELDDETTGINSLTLGEILDVDKDADTTPAIIKALYSSKLSSLNSDIADL
ncbi:MAG: hypothetical protein IJ371_03395, partial [Clostridia bacterium]|nr:hypothetical protein [Clostridia bacterium]